MVWSGYGHDLDKNVYVNGLMPLSFTEDENVKQGAQALYDISDLQENALKLDRIIAEFHQQSDRFNIQIMRFFLNIAARHGHGGATEKELRVPIGILRTTAIRYRQFLGEGGPDGEPGLGLIRVEPDPREPRRYLFRLTEEGLAFANLLVQHFNTDDAKSPVLPEAKSGLTRRSA